MNWLVRLILTFLLLGAWAVVGYFYVGYTLDSPNRQERVQMEIPAGASTSEIGMLLKENGLIRKSWFFAPYVWWKGYARKLQAGVFEIPPQAQIDEILEILTKGKRDVVRVTIPEGFTVEQIADRLAKELNIDREAFLEAVQKEDYKYSFVQNIPLNKNRKYRLEGYLFPSTYHFEKGVTPEEIVDQMLAQFNRLLEKEGVREELKKRNLTVDEWVTVASLIEREGRVWEEFPAISGVIYNRLNRGMLLQVDATVQYALGKQKEILTYDDLKLNSPYNTYLNKGLPPGPIANPGEKALEAAIQPMKHDYLFYVTRKDGTGKHYFARTQEEHQANINRSKQNQQQAKN